MNDISFPLIECVGHVDACCLFESKQFQNAMTARGTSPNVDSLAPKSLRLATFQGYELSKQNHILALQSDQVLITEALRPLAQCGYGEIWRNMEDVSSSR